MYDVNKIRIKIKKKKKRMPMAKIPKMPSIIF